MEAYIIDRQGLLVSKPPAWLGAQLMQLSARGGRMVPDLVFEGLEVMAESRP